MIELPTAERSVTFGVPNRSTLFRGRTSEKPYQEAKKKMVFRVQVFERQDSVTGVLISENTLL